MPGIAEQPWGCLLTVIDTCPFTGKKFSKICNDIMWWADDSWVNLDEELAPLEVIAWIPLPRPYEGEMGND